MLTTLAQKNAKREQTLSRKATAKYFQRMFSVAPDVISSMHLDEKSKNLKRKVRVLVHCHLIIVDFNIKFCDRRLPRMH